jgi:hypothetical protein
VEVLCHRTSREKCIDEREIGQHDKQSRSCALGERPLLTLHETARLGTSRRYRFTQKSKSLTTANRVIIWQSALSEFVLRQSCLPSTTNRPSDTRHQENSADLRAASRKFAGRAILDCRSKYLLRKPLWLNPVSELRSEGSMCNVDD